MEIVYVQNTLPGFTWNPQCWDIELKLTRKEQAIVRIKQQPFF